MRPLSLFFSQLGIIYTKLIKTPPRTFYDLRLCVIMHSEYYFLPFNQSSANSIILEKNTIVSTSSSRNKQSNINTIIPIMIPNIIPIFLLL